MDYSNFYFHKNCNCSISTRRAADSTIISQCSSIVKFRMSAWCVTSGRLSCHIYFLKIYSSTKFMLLLASYIAKVSLMAYSLLLFLKLRTCAKILDPSLRFQFLSQNAYTFPRKSLPRILQIKFLSVSERSKNSV